jgi:hypothetical protein
MTLNPSLTPPDSAETAARGGFSRFSSRVARFFFANGTSAIRVSSPSPVRVHERDSDSPLAGGWEALRVEDTRPRGNHKGAKRVPLFT